MNDFDIGDNVFVNIIADPKINNSMYAVIEGTLKHIPNATGDSWIIKTEDGRLTSFNPNCSHFLGVSKIIS